MNNFLVYRNKIRSGVRPVIGHPINIDHFLTQGLVGHWTFNEGAGSYAYDYSGHNNTGTLTNGPTWTTLSTNEKVLSFDGSDDYVNCGNGASLNVTNAITIEAWFNIAAYPPDVAGKDWYNFLSKASFRGSYGIMYKRDGTFRFYLNPMSSLDCIFTPTLNTWYHLVGTWDGSAAKIFLDGVEKVSGPRSGTLNSNNYPVRISLDIDENHPFNGLIDDVRIYNRALSPGEIQYLYTKTQARYK